jgi:hypothetical protein
MEENKKKSLGNLRRLYRIFLAVFTFSSDSDGPMGCKFFLFTLFGDCRISQLYKFMSFSTLGTFWALFLQNVLSLASVPIFSSNHTYVRGFDILSHGPWSLHQF